MFTSPPKLGRWMLAVGLLVFVASSATAVDSQPPFVKIKRAALWVPDLDRAILFYRDVLGFTVDSIDESDVMDDPVVHDLYNSDPQLPVRSALFSSSTEKRALFVMESGVAPELHKDAGRDASLVIQTNEFSAVIQRAKAMGFGVGKGNTDRTPKGGAFSERVIIGPGGQAVLVYQYEQSP